MYHIKTALYGIAIALGIAAALIAFFMLLYLVLASIFWIFSDPFNLIKDIEVMERLEDEDVVRCREAGGYPIISGWSGNLKECAQ